jgi:hypothetical protein
MSIGPLGFVSSVAGSPLAQTKGSEVERAQHETAGVERQQEGSRKAERAAGVGAADGEDHQTADRDADGRRLWEAPLAPSTPSDQAKDDAGAGHGAKDPTGESGGSLDLIG